MIKPARQHMDPELIELEDLVLKQNGYLVRQETLEEVPYLFAEDMDNIVVASAVLTADDVQAIEPILTRALVERLSDRRVESKKWDGYVAILMSTNPDDNETDALFSVTHNLSQVRRLIRTGIDATAASVARGLRGILPLSQTPGEAILNDPLSSLGSRLIADGVDPEQVDALLAGFDSVGYDDGDSDHLEDDETLIIGNADSDDDDV